MKQLITYALAFAITFLFFYLLHYNIVNKETPLPFSLYEMYLFHAISSFIISSLFSIISKNENILNVLGLFYLLTILLKLGLFAIIFEPVFKAELSKMESLHLLMPMFIFLFLEVFFISKILSKNTSK